MDEYISDVDDFFDEQNKGLKPDPIDELADEMIDIMAMNLGDVETGNKVFEACENDMYIKLYEKYIKGRGYDYSRLRNFEWPLRKVKYAYAHNGNLHIHFKPNHRYTLPNLANVEMLAFLINRQIGVDENIENTSSD